MYRLEWLEQLKLRTAAAPKAQDLGRVSPVVWRLGFTSFLTDISAEMVNSALPGYLVLFLHLSPLQFGVIDGVYNGFAVALLSLGAGILADRTRRPKLLAIVGYGLSASCKLLLLFGGAAWTAILGIVWLDRSGKSIRTAPRDTILSLNSSPALMATSFALHRALDAFGSMLGPLVTFALLWRDPTAYRTIWIVSFGVAVLGVAVLWLMVSDPRRVLDVPAQVLPRLRTVLSGRLVRLAGVALLLSCLTISDAFVYLALQQQGGPGAAYFPLFYVGTATGYVLLSVPAGRLADRFGRLPVLIAGYAALALLYALLLRSSAVGVGTVVLALGLLGLFYAASEGVLAAMTSVAVPAISRGTGLAVVATLAGIGKLVSSVLFGWLWETKGVTTSVSVFGVLLIAALLVSALLLRQARSPVAV